MTIKTLTAALLADRDRPSSSTHNIIPCFVCGYTFIYRGRQGDLNRRFCSMRCQEWYDAGNPPATDQKISYGMKAGSKGFYIACGHCNKEFESLGLRCCSTECERGYIERERNLAVMAEAGIEPKVKRQCEQCGVQIPRWRNGRQVSNKTRFCSPKCQQRAKRAAA